MGAAFQGQFESPAGGDQGGHQGLENQGGTARAAHGERITPRNHGTRAEGQSRGSEFGALQAGGAYPGGGFDASQVLTHQSGLLAAGADPVDAKGFAGGHGQGQGGAEDLASAFAAGTVQYDFVGHGCRVRIKYDYSDPDVM